MEASDLPINNLGDIAISTPYIQDKSHAQRISRFIKDNADLIDNEKFDESSVNYWG